MTSKTEAATFRRLNDYVRKQRGGEIFHADILYPGFPDKMILLPNGQVMFAELKRPGGSLRPGQLYWRKRLQTLGFEAEIFYEYQALIEWIEREEKTD